MIDRIRVLPDSVANQIAAGEVVQSPASVVKEMMENAVDAGARTVTVKFRDSGRERIQGVDAGCGMSPADARMAFERHATSKIRSADDIYALSTFGFRGEALAAIGAVAEVEVRTRQADEQLGIRVEIGGGAFRSQEPVSCPVGTQFMVRNLFYNIPARRRFLDKKTTESRQIRNEFRRVALCHPDVNFLLYENDAPLYNLPAATLKQRIVNVFGKTITGNLLDVSADTTVVRIEGFTGRPSSARATGREQYLFVNGRYFQKPTFHAAVLKAYEKLLAPGTQPSYFLFLTVDPDRIDVNVNPDKIKVKFEDEAVIWQIIVAAVRESLGKTGIVPQMDFDSDTSFDIPVHRPGVNYAMPPSTVREGYTPFSPEYEIPSGKMSPSGDFDLADDFVVPARGANLSAARDYVEYPSGGDSQDDEALIEFIEGESALQGELELDAESKFEGALLLRGGCVATSVDGRLVVADARRAREAVLYDRYLTLLGNEAAATQQLLFPLSITLGVDDHALLEQHLADFAAFGFDLAAEDALTVEIAGIPADFTASVAEELIYELLDALETERSAAGDVRRRRMAAAMAASGARRGAVNTAEEAAQLLDALSRCANMSFTPSGLEIFAIVPDSVYSNKPKP